MTDFHNSSHFQFIFSQILLTLSKGRRYDNESLILIAILHTISFAAYKMLHNSGSIALTRIKVIREMASKCSQDTNLRPLFDKLFPKQTLVKIFFDKVKLTQAIHFTCSHVFGHVHSVSDASESRELTTHALAIQVFCHCGRPPDAVRVITVAKL